MGIKYHSWLIRGEIRKKTKKKYGEEQTTEYPGIGGTRTHTRTRGPAYQSTTSPNAKEIGGGEK